jgi:hypothetical protein
VPPINIDEAFVLSSVWAVAKSERATIQGSSPARAKAKPHDCLLALNGDTKAMPLHPQGATWAQPEWSMRIARWRTFAKKEAGQCASNESSLKLSAGSELRPRIPDPVEHELQPS